LCAAGIVFGISAWLQIKYLVSACRNISEWLALGGLAAVGWLLVIGLIWRICQPNKHNALVLKTGVLILTVAAISASVLLIVDGRYRDFPISLYALPILLLSFSSVLLEVDVRPQRWLGYVLSSVLMVAALYCVYLETENISAYYWLVLCGLIVTALWPKPQASTVQTSTPSLL